MSRRRSNPPARNRIRDLLGVAILWCLAAGIIWALWVKISTP